MAPLLPIILLKNIKPFKTAWKIEVKILHIWKQYSFNSGETLEMVLADEEGTKIHASVKKEHVVRYERFLVQGQWKLIQNISLSHAIGQYRTTNHVYKIGFVKETFVSKSDHVCDNIYLSLAKFQTIQNGGHNQSILCDILGQVVNVGEIELLEVANKPTKKIEFELRDEKNFRIGCTLWGTFAEKIFQTCQAAGGEMVICLLRFAKIKEFREVKSVSNAFNASTLEINPTYSIVEDFTNSLPNDGLSLTLLESKPKSDIVVVSDDYWNQFPIITIDDLLTSTEVGKAKILCTILEIDTDWGWYYFGCIKKNHKKVYKAKTEANQLSEAGKKPKFWCDICKENVTNVVAKYKLHLKVGDQTSEIKCILFDTLGNEIVKHTASELLDGSLDEMEDPEDVPDAIKNLVGKTYQFVLSIQKENLNGGHDTFKVTKIITTDGMIVSDSKEELEHEPNSSELVSGGQITLMLQSSQEFLESENSNNVTPSSKRKEDREMEVADQFSVTKKLCLKPVKVEKVKS